MDRKPSYNLRNYFGFGSLWRTVFVALCRPTTIHKKREGSASDLSGAGCFLWIDVESEVSAPLGEVESVDISVTVRADSCCHVP